MNTASAAWRYDTRWDWTAPLVSVQQFVGGVGEGPARCHLLKVRWRTQIYHVVELTLQFWLAGSRAKQLSRHFYNETVGSPEPLTWEHLARPPWSPPCRGINEDLGGSLFTFRWRLEGCRGLIVRWQYLPDLLAAGRLNPGYRPLHFFLKQENQNADADPS